VRTDAPADMGGRGEYYSPTELIPAALGTCVMSMMGVVAERNGVDISGMNVDVRMEMARSPSRIGSITAVVKLPDAKGVSETVRQKMEVAADTCPVKRSLHPDTKVTLEFVYGQ
jgi:putative redox protein